MQVPFSHASPLQTKVLDLEIGDSWLHGRYFLHFARLVALGFQAPSPWVAGLTNSLEPSAYII